VHGQLDTSQAAKDKKKGKDKKLKNRDTDVLAAEKGKALPRHQGKPDDLPFNFVLPSTPSRTVYKK
jgi:hypothetical protein